MLKEGQNKVKTRPKQGQAQPQSQLQFNGF